MWRWQGPFSERAVFITENVADVAATDGSESRPYQRDAFTTAEGRLTKADYAIVIDVSR